MSGTRRTGVGAFLALVAVGVGCMSGCGRGAEVEPAAEQDRPTIPTPLFEGLVAPKGATLAGAAFAQPNHLGGSVVAPDGPPMPDSLNALLTIEGDPFEVWDDLAAQFRAQEPAVLMPGSADSCTWSYPNGMVPADELTAPTQFDALLEITAEPPDPRTDGISCHARAPGEVDGVLTTYGMALQASDRWPLALSVSRTSWPSESIVPAFTEPAAQLSDFRASRAANTAGSTAVIPPSSAAVPAGAAENLPTLAPQPTPLPGEPFGSDVNCFARSAGPRTVVPEGTAVVGDAWVSGSVSVLAVDDPATAIAALAQQFEGDGSDLSSSPTLEVVDLDDGAQVLQYTHVITAGGGGCTVLESPDGGFVQISRHSD